MDIFGSFNSMYKSVHTLLVYLKFMGDSWIFSDLLECQDIDTWRDNEMPIF